MTIGVLSRRTGVSVKTLREYEDLGLIYSVGRSEGNYRLFGEEALWCVGMVNGLRRLGLTIAEIQEPLSSPSGRSQTWRWAGARQTASGAEAARFGEIAPGLLPPLARTVLRHPLATGDSSN